MKRKLLITLSFSLAACAMNQSKPLMPPAQIDKPAIQKMSGCKMENKRRICTA